MLEIIFENKSFFIINKPSNLVVLPDKKNINNTLLNIINKKFLYLSKIENSGIVHRLDKDTTGLILVAKNKEYYFLFKKMFFLRKIIKEYLAIVSGELISGGKIDKNISRHKYKKTKNWINEYGKKSITYFNIKEKLKLHTFIKIKLITGRTHQIRVHLSYINHPIIGDKKYKNNSSNFKKSYEFLKKNNLFIKRQALHANKIKFRDPITNKLIKVKIDIPDDMKNIIKFIKKKY